MREIKGRVFDIRQFSVHDGEGIRTTIFLKGCPLHCVWCQNPEGIASNGRLIYFADKCIHCGACLLVSQGAVSEIAGKITIVPEAVTAGEEYERQCPTGALRMDSREYMLEEVLETALRDLPFFLHGGGVTLSGGEPFLQQEFTLALLKELKEKGIHTAVESSLCTDLDYFKKVLPYIDRLFADFKVFLPEEHKRYTGIDPMIIRENLRYVLQSEYKDNVVVRTPLIPGYTATKENLTAIARWLAAVYPQVCYELLNYNPLAKAKYVHVDFPYGFSENPPMYTKAELLAFRDLIFKAGVVKVFVEI
jgi:pyruvate formate lyase activating enzyme